MAWIIYISHILCTLTLVFSYIHGVLLYPELYEVESVSPFLYGLIILYLFQDYTCSLILCSLKNDLAL